MERKRYLQIVSSFDEFAEKAAPKTVYYNPGDEVFYWLSLGTIWGYIGYSSSTGKFTFNGRRYSVIPAVPDPEDLFSPVVLDSLSFPSDSQNVTFESSDFSIVPVQQFLNYYGKLTLDYAGRDDFNSIKLGSTNVQLEFLNYDFDNLNSITSVDGLANRGFTLTVNDSNGVIDLDGFSIAVGVTANKNIVFKKTEGNLSEDALFKNIDGNLNKLVGFGFSVDCTYVTSILMKVRPSVSLPFYCSNLANGYELIIDASKNGGVVPDDYYVRLGFTESSPKYASSIVYRNVTDYGTYYKRFMMSDDYLPIPSDVLNQNKTKTMELFSGNNVSSGDWGRVANTSYNLDGVKSFIYYKGAWPRATAGTVQGLTSYSDITTLGSLTVGGTSIYSTPKLSNVNVEYFCLTNFGATYLNTDDSDIYVKHFMSPSTSGITIYVGKENIHITGEAVKSDGSSLASLSFACADSLEKGTVYVEDIEHGSRMTLSINEASSVTGRLRFNIAGCTGKQAPTPDDYYNTGVDFSDLVYRSTYLADIYDVVIMRRGYTSDYLVPINKIVCLYGGGDFATNTVVSTASDMEKLISVVPNIQSTATFRFSEAQYAFMTSAQIDYILGLGYTITIVH